MTLSAEEFERRKKDIVSSALKVLRKNGLDKFSLRSVAKAAGFSPAGLYEYFKNKEDLLSAIKLRINSEMYEYIEKRMNQSDDELISLSKAYLSYAFEHTDDYLLFFGQFISKKKSVDDLQKNRSTYDLLWEALTRLFDAKNVKAEPQIVEIACFGLWSFLHGQVMLRLTHLKDYQADFNQANELVIRAYLNGIVE